MNTLDEEEIERLIACDKLLSMAEARIPQLEAEVKRLTAEVEFRKEQIAELFDKRTVLEAVVRQLREYVVHRGYGNQGPGGCAANVTVKRTDDNWPPCDCGLMAVRNAAAKVLGETK